MKGYKEWTVVFRFLSLGLMGIEMREIIKESDGVSNKPNLKNIQED